MEFHLHSIAFITQNSISPDDHLWVSHLVSYYTLEDAKNNLRTPKEDPRLKYITINQELLKQTYFKSPTWIMLAMALLKVNISINTVDTITQAELNTIRIPMAPQWDTVTPPHTLYPIRPILNTVYYYCLFRCTILLLIELKIKKSKQKNIVTAGLALIQ